MISHQVQLRKKGLSLRTARLAESWRVAIQLVNGAFYIKASGLPRHFVPRKDEKTGLPSVCPACGRQATGRRTATLSASLCSQLKAYAAKGDSQ